MVNTGIWVHDQMGDLGFYNMIFVKKSTPKDPQSKLMGVLNGTTCRVVLGVFNNDKDAMLVRARLITTMMETNGNTVMDVPAAEEV